MIEKLKYIENDWDKFEKGIRFFLATYDEIIKHEKESKFRIIEKFYINLSTIDHDKDTIYFIGIEREYDKGLSIDKVVNKIKESLTSAKNKKIFLKKKGDGYSFCFNHYDGSCNIAFSACYHNSRAAMVFGLSHIYYGK